MEVSATHRVVGSRSISTLDCTLVHNSNKIKKNQILWTKISELFMHVTIQIIL